ncbi:MAG: RNA-binding transcriptional accessory protein [Defluviitaleaceae bacterium]|nr:RNA-binding transcriptional accessory protein [Defluviitaleaceae bacterium]MCL2275586.1 RNA-binding transcriptional accessory protein [Defluviitaleaceae bacterium]
MDIIQTLVQELTLTRQHAENIVQLIDEGNTIPFIARYRKEATGEIDDQKLRTFSERLEYLRNLEDRKNTVRTTLEEQGNLSPELDTALKKAVTLTEVEDIYRPFKPKRRTRATMALEKGLGELAEIIFAQEIKDLHAAAAPFIDAEKGVESIEDALNGASDIIAEKISDDPACRTFVRNVTQREGMLIASATKTAKEAMENPTAETKAQVYEMYFDFAEPVKKIAGHRVLAVNRGENEGWLKVTIEAPEENILAGLNRMYVKNNPATRNFMEAAAADSYKRLTAPAVERELRTMLTETAEEAAIKVFTENLRQLIMQAPVKGHTVLAIDPGFRTGCKLAVVDETGKVLETGVVFCTTTKDTAPSKKQLAQMIVRHSVSIIAIGNGTASRETEMVVAELLKETRSSAKYIIVNEAGASVYSASKLGAEEFPDFDVALRSAVSIARRLQDPLAELVKIDPKSIGVGQYQHDMNQKRLTTALGGVVEDCVNKVGVDLNTASPSLLAYVAGINPAIAKNILTFREENGKFTSRAQLKKVAKLGPKAFEQCAGFLRIPGAKNPLDNTSVHPESYAIAEKIKIQPITDCNRLESLAAQLSIGLPTLTDIIRELEKPGRDPRDELPPVLLRSDVLAMEDLTEGMMLTGTVRNVIDFGAFVDIGVHQDGLVHISQLCDRFIKHPLEAVQVGDVVQVKVLSVDVKRKRISLTMKAK